MRKFLLLLLLFSLSVLAACSEADESPTEEAASTTAPEPTMTSQPTPEPTATTDPNLVTDSAQLVGVWEGSIAGETGYMMYTGDGEFHLSLILDGLLETPRVRGDYWFEENLLHVQDLENNGHWAECDSVGVYEVSWIDENRLQMAAVDENCSTGGFTRQYVFTNMTMKWLGEPEMLSAEPAESESDAVASESGELEAALQALLDNAVANGAPGAVLLIDVPTAGFKWKGAAGMADVPGQLAMHPDEQYIISSITKMYTAATILLLVEDERLALDDPAADYLPEGLLDSLSDSTGSPITVRQLLNHTSGLGDFSNGADLDGNGVPDFKDLVLAEPDTLWTYEMVLEWASENTPPVGSAGEQFFYSDTNYQLAGMIIEEASGLTLAEAYRQYIFAPLQMDHTYFEFNEAIVAGIDGRSVSHPLYLGNDWTEFDSHSYEWGSGGLVSTVEDQNRFLWAWRTGELFAESTSLDEMRLWVDTPDAGGYYGLGTYQFVLEEWGIPGLGTLEGHGGLFNSLAYYWPEQNATIIGTLNNNEPFLGFIGLLIEVMTLVETHIE